MLFEDVEIHGAPAFALLSREAYKITLDNVRVIPGKTPLRATVQRLLSSNADGLHFKESHGEIHIKTANSPLMEMIPLSSLPAMLPLLEIPMAMSLPSPQNRNWKNPNKVI